MGLLISLALLLFLLTLASRFLIAYYLANDDPGDSAVYSRLARNMLEHGVFSVDEQPPYDPTLIRMPGYPIFLAGVYSVFGQDNNTAVRVVQAFIDTATCVMAAMIAWFWTSDKRRRMLSAFLTYTIISICPFIAIYAATVLTETLVTFLMAGMTLAATLSFRSRSLRSAAVRWALCGLLGGATVMLRPDSGLFIAGVGLTVVLVSLIHGRGKLTFGQRLLRLMFDGALLSIGFGAILAPWTIRNYQVFGIVQPLAPVHAAMPGEFVPEGYFKWLRSWVDDSRFIEPTQWDLGEKPLEVGKFPSKIFDSQEEKVEVAGLFEAYNHPPGDEHGETTDDKNAEDDASTIDSSGRTHLSSAADQADESSGDEKTEDAMANENDDTDPDNKFVVKMTPEIDAGFAAIAQRRIERSPARYYLFLPVKRAAAMWFDSHSLYYPFGGQMSPIKDLDWDEFQQYWLPVFTLITWLLTILGAAGLVVLWKQRRRGSNLTWLLLSVLLILPRIAFLSTIENPEPRYVVELFFFAAILGGLYLSYAASKRRVRDHVRVFSVPRLVSLDTLRGTSIAAMILVNEPGTWSSIYAPLQHADWNGATPTDLIFPFFLYTVGFSITLSIDERPEKGWPWSTYAKVFRRSAILFALGLILNALPIYNLWTGLWFEPGNLRLLGVLQRISICYLIASLLYMHATWRQQAIISGATLLLHWALLTLVRVPDCGVPELSDKLCNLASYIDRSVLGENHIWDQSPAIDPEGLLSTIGAIVTTVAGTVSAGWMKNAAEPKRKLGGLLLTGAASALIGWLWAFWYPLNKTLWTGSYVLLTAGLAAILLATLYWLMDVKGYQKPALPFVVFGTNAITLYLFESFVDNFLTVAEVEVTSESTTSLQEVIFNGVFAPLASPEVASLLYGAAFLLVCFVLMSVLYRRRVFVRI